MEFCDEAPEIFWVLGLGAQKFSRQFRILTHPKFSIKLSKLSLLKCLSFQKIFTVIHVLRRAG